ncbi:hypothetical protein MKW94_017613 [Papaver nudicaule]|uniref:3'-5' exonuclease domain-containing protein n=1 Tax=Papaver nudicaule TaxID=74823 RepID=A0AA41V268_PAPNU|nr:hypothetical protein [Papaver nudicaule]
MAGSSSVQKVQNGLANLSLNGGSSWGDQMSSNSSTSNGGRVRGGHKNTHIEVFDKSKSTHHSYDVYFYNEKIRTTVTHTAYVLDQWIKNIYSDYHDKLDNLVVGLDIEWRRMRNQIKRNKVDVLQLCVGRRCLIFQFSCCDKIPKSLYDFLGNKKFIFVGAGIESHAYKLLADYNLKVARTEELGDLAAYKLTDNTTDYKFLHGAELKDLAKAVLEKELPKKEYIEWSNWGRGFLRDEQVEYACLDAFVSFQLAMDLMNRDRKEGKTKANGGIKTNGTNRKRAN